jgi:hypothetical protein
MTELDQAPATTATETADRPAAGEQRPGSRDTQARYPNALSTADADPGYYDSDIQAALAADTTPTRQQASRDAAAQDHQASDNTANARRDRPASGRDSDIDAILHENDHLPDPRTRQQAARDAATHDEAGNGVSATSHETPASGLDADIEAILHENDGMPDPRTRQQAARDAAVETSPASRDDLPPATGDHRASGLDPLTHSRSNDTPTVADPAAADQATLDRRQPDHADGDQHVDVVRTRPEDRTLGDTTPTGIGLKPTGDDLVHIERDDPKESRADRLFNKAFEMMDDVHDTTGHIAEAIQQDLPHGSGGLPSAHSAYVMHEQPSPPPDAPGVGDVVGNITVVGVMAVVGFRRLLGHRMKGNRA